MKVTKKILSVMLAAAMSASLLSGCSGGAQPDAQETKAQEESTGLEMHTEEKGAEGETVNTGKTAIRVAIDREPTALSPGGASVNITDNIILSVFDTLLKYDENLVPGPNLATEWKDLDDTTWEFKLREDVTFTNGDPLTAKDVLYSLRRLPDTVAGGLAVARIDLDGCKAVDDYTVQIKTYEPYAFLEAQLCQATTVIVNERAIAEMGEDAYARNPVGSGPFKLEEWVAGDHITLARNDNYWGEVAKLETVEFKIMTEGAARTMNLESGDVDLNPKLQITDIDRIKESEDMRVLAGPGNALRYIAINTGMPHLDNVNVRKALAHATDTELLRTTVYGADASAPASGTVPSSLKDHVDVPVYEYNPERAKELLKEEGLENGLELTLSYLAGTSANMCAEMLQAMWAEAGVTLKLSPMESGALTTLQNEGKHQLGNCGSNMKLCDAGDGLYGFFHTDSRGTSQNRTWLVDEEVDAILDKAMTIFDPEERGKLVQEAQVMVNELCPTINICYPYNVYGYRSDLRGLKCLANDMIDYSQLYFVNEN